VVKILQVNNSKGGKTCLGSWFQEFDFMITFSIVLGLCLPKAASVVLMGMRFVHSSQGSKERNKDLRTNIPIKGTPPVT
jgi:hypothetical protein